MSNDVNSMIGHCESVDFDVHGFVGIRLITPSASDTDAVTRQLGPLCVPSLSREPDICIRFERHVPTPHLTYLGSNEAGYTRDGFYILKSKKAPAKVKIPFETIGDTCEIVCESGLRAVPLLVQILNLTLLRKDCIPLHASAFVFGGVGILTTGWSKGGKTEALLAFGSEGASYVGDEWVILTKDGGHMYGLPEPICVWDWHIDQLPVIQQYLKRSRSFTFEVIHMFEWAHKYLQRGRLGRAVATRALGEAMPALKRQLHINLEPDKVFCGRLFKLEAPVHKVFLMSSHNDSSIVVESWDCRDIARRMLHSVCYEQMRLLEYYRAFRFAFPALRNELLENIEEVQSRLLSSALEAKTAYRVLHPYPVSLKALFKEMAPLCASL